MIGTRLAPALVAVLALAACGRDTPAPPTTASTAEAPTTAAPERPVVSATATSTVHLAPPVAPPPAPAPPSAPPPGSTSAPADAAATAPRKESAMIGVGDPFPPVRVKDQHGRDRSIADFAGRRVVIWWFPKADTPG